MNTNSIPQLEQLLQVNEQLMGLPALPLIFIGCIMFGMFLKAVPIYPNKWIPAGVFLNGILLNVLITPLDNLQGITRSLILGLIAGGGAWIAHKKVVSFWVSTADLKNGDTEIIKKKVE